ncbi:hypothetical protein B5X24_HaOG200731 [Helicoverpa armigera]|uniref:Gustatory receptor n=1 Tax=Helicoverpa armigera TaxID=29058 RepID=A0A2W1BRY4_HELAM|nr:hypothetical protein B5X24_HaOG200731 [Helicoverpa armigera]
MKFYRKTETKTNVHLVFNNLLDKDVQSIFFPLNLMHYIVFCPKYTIKNNFIIPTSFIVKLISILGTLVFISVTLYRNYYLFFYQESVTISPFMYYSSYYDALFYSFGFSMNCLFGIFKSELIIRSIMTFQNIHRYLNNESNTRRNIILNWTYVIVTFVGYFSIYTYFYSQLSNSYNLTNAFFLVSFDINAVLAIRSLNLLEDKISLWNVSICKNQELENVNDRNYAKKMYQAYVNVLECYETLKTLSRSFVST